jgi:molybdopterin converting factor small subunit
LTLRVEVRLFASLRSYLPSGSDGARTVVELPDGGQLGDVIERLRIPTQLAQLVMVNGIHESGRDRTLRDGDTLSIFPPVAGGCLKPESAISAH